MKKRSAAMMLVALMACATSAYAVDRTDPRYQEIKALKEKQRAEKEARKNNPPPVNENSFWHREGVRSGLGDTGNRAGSFLKNLNPVPFFKRQQEKYNERKAGGVK